jgi:hypothetical protein
MQIKMCFLNFAILHFAICKIRGIPDATQTVLRLEPAARYIHNKRMDRTLNSRLAMISLPDSDGRAIRLGSLWLRQPAIIVFLRHYG